MRAVSPITNVIWTFGLIRAEYESKIELKYVSMAPYAQIDTLNSGQKTTIFMSDYLRDDVHTGIRVQPNQFEGMEVGCSVTFKYLFATEKKIFRFRCILNKQSDYQWIRTDSEAKPINTKRSEEHTSELQSPC